MQERQGTSDLDLTKRENERIVKQHSAVYESDYELVLKHAARSDCVHISNSLYSEAFSICDPQARDPASIR